MSYESVGELESWWGLSESSAEVYVYRFEASGIPIGTDGAPADPIDLLDFASVVGRNQLRSLDIRGVGVMKVNGQPLDQWTIDVVATGSFTGAILPQPFEPNMNAALQDDAGVRARYPNIKILNGSWYEMSSPQASVDFWRSQPVVWDHLLTSGQGGRGGPTSSFARPAAYSIFYGSSDLGGNVKSLQPKEVPLGSKPSSDGGIALPSLSKNMGLSGAEVILGLAVLGIIVWVNRDGKRPRRQQEDWA